VPHRLVQPKASHTPPATTETVPARLVRKIAAARRLDADRMNSHGHKLTLALTVADAEWLLAHLPQALCEDVA
jgi:hypothetical protein